MVAWFVITLPIVAVGVALQTNKDRLNRFFMGFFRDLGRVKAYRRRHQGNHQLALMTVLMKQEDPLLGIDFDEEPDTVPTYTLEELWEYGSNDSHTNPSANGDEDDQQQHQRLLLSVFGRIYDVTAGTRFYGPHARYHMFPGHDVTYALGTGCKTEECLERSAEELQGKELEEAKRWLSFFQLHDQYAYVGKLENNPMEAMMEQWIEEAIQKHQQTGEKVEMPNLF